MRSHEQVYEPYEYRAVIGVDPSGGVVHESGIDPEIDRERCERGSTKEHRVLPGREGEPHGCR